MKRNIIILILAAVAFSNVTALPDEENLKVLIKITRKKIFAISTSILPEDGENREQVEATFGKPKTEYLPNPDDLRTLEYDLSVYSTNQGPKTVMPCTLSVTYHKDVVADTFLYMPSLDCFDTTISRDQIGRRNDTWHTRYLIDLKTLKILEQIKLHFAEMKTPNKAIEATK